MMNAEKELLLELLIEKYTIKTQPIIRVENKIQRVKHQRHYRGINHQWTNAEKQHLIDKRKQGYSFSAIAKIMGLRVQQCKNMYYKSIPRDKAAS